MTDDLRTVALYARVSSEEQTERETIEGQLDFVRQYATLYQMQVYGEYLDDGWSGTIPLAERPGGARLLADARAGRFRSVVAFNVKRFGRRLSVLLHAHDTLAELGVTIQSATEPIDTSNHMGRFIFQLLGSLAELDRATMLEQLTLGRDRVLKSGRWLGVVPVGYTVVDGRAVPNETPVSSLERPECELVSEMLSRIAGGSTAAAEARYWSAISMPSVRRYPNGTEITISSQWSCSRLNYIIHNPTYKGEHVVHSRHGDIVQPTPPLVTPETWLQAQAQLVVNRAMSTRLTSDYPLRGIVFCGKCGRRYTGNTVTSGKSPRRLYRCGGVSASAKSNVRDRCRSKSISADRLERIVWQWCIEQLSHPEAIVDRLRDEMLKQDAAPQAVATEVERVKAAISHKANEKGRVVTLFRRGIISQDDAERELANVDREAAELETTLAGLTAQDDVRRRYESAIASTADLLARLAASVVQAESDATLKRLIIDDLIERVVILSDTARGDDVRIVGRL